ncbi:hypothetical protein ALC62_00576 [Cyphomyrmex costatus]|uniref:Uncharacterized protein n=1 Tax=Cyphomyrmex costatus TaxID=456900 RepID=A0A151IQK0_9HYME|nr:hypothetical protein ALC62_00576 [Cyphomyrmex costatus]
MIRLKKWRDYTIATIGDYLRYLRAIVGNVGDLHRFAWTPTAVVTQAIRTQHRVLYYVHGKSVQYNFTVQTVHNLDVIDQNGIQLRGRNTYNDNNVKILERSEYIESS